MDTAFVPHQAADRFFIAVYNRYTLSSFCIAAAIRHNGPDFPMQKGHRIVRPSKVGPSGSEGSVKKIGIPSTHVSSRAAA